MSATLRDPNIQRLLAALRGEQNVSSKDPYATHAETGNTQSVDRKTYDTVEVPQVADPVVVKTGREASTQGKIPPSTLPGNTTTRSNTPLATDVPDPSSITTWPAAIKHVTRYTVNDTKTVDRIKHLISEQHKHEKQWWMQREALIVQQSEREGSQAQAADLLKSLGGFDVSVTPTSAEEKAKELEAFDQKVYRSLLQMTEDFHAQLRKTGVPFFANKQDLILRKNDAEKTRDEKGCLSEDSLKTMQRRMVQALEDLLTDD